MSDLITDGLPQASEVNVLDTFNSIGLRRSIRWVNRSSQLAYLRQTGPEQAFGDKNDSQEVVIN